MAWAGHHDNHISPMGRASSGPSPGRELEPWSIARTLSLSGMWDEQIGFPAVGEPTHGCVSEEGDISDSNGSVM